MISLPTFDSILVTGNQTINQDLQVNGNQTVGVDLNVNGSQTITGAFKSTPAPRLSTIWV